MNTHSKPTDTRSRSDLRHFSSVVALIEDALRKGVFPGVSLLVATHGEVLLEATWGHCRPGGSPVASRTYFDLASLTKPLITTPLLLYSIDRKKIGLDDSMSRFVHRGILPADKRAITIRQLLNHCSGLPSYRAFYKELVTVPPAEKGDWLLSRILEEPLLAPSGKEAHYSDLGFQLLGIILETVWEEPLDLLASRVLLGPNSWLRSLGPDRGRDNKESHPAVSHPGDEITFCRLEVQADPTSPPKRLNAPPVCFAATEVCPWRNRLLEGEVHDENAYSLEGVAGHAGLFGTARGMLSLIDPLWTIYKTTCGGTPRVSSELAKLVRTFWTRQHIADGSTWALGFDTPSTSQSSAGIHFSPRSVGHLGFTGTSFWLDLDREVLVILLTNRVHPTRNNNKIREFRPLLHNLVMEAYYA
jgi:serine-type D-Ala-D-Ala carboxypeptidase